MEIVHVVSLYTTQPLRYMVLSSLPPSLCLSLVLC